MRGSDRIQALVVGVVILGLIILIGRGLGVGWDPLGLGERRLVRAEQQARHSAVEAHARQLEARGQAEQITRLEGVQAERERIGAITAHTIEAAKRAQDARTPIDPARLERLRQHDRQLCLGAANTAACAATVDPA